MGEREDLTVLRCHHCQGTGCRACAQTGSIFWADGRCYPYTPEGEKRALAAAQRDMAECGR